MNTKLLDALVLDGQISQSDNEAAALFAKRRQMHVEEALLQMGVLDEAALLKYLANHYKTYFVSTKKLSSAPISDSLLKLVTHKLAKRFWIFPVKYDQRAQELSVLTVQPDDLDVLKNVQFATRVPKVRALVARPAAIMAAIKRHYEDEIQAFGAIRDAGVGTGLSVDRSASATSTHEQLTPAAANSSSMSLPPVGDDPMAGMIEHSPQRARRPTRDGAGVPPPPPPTAMGTHQTMGAQPAPVTAHQTMGAQPAPAINPHQTLGAQQAPAISPHQTLGAQPSPVLAQQQVQGNPQAQSWQQAPEPVPQMDDPALQAMREAEAVAAAPKEQGPAVPIHDYLETLNVLVALLENERGELKGHSLNVARICRRLCERLGLNGVESDAIIIAAYLHDIGKSSAYHLTALNVAQYDAHRQQARKSYMTPVRIFEAVRLVPGVSDILTHLYERFDGEGFPDRLTGKEIRLGARVLAIVETYADLTGHEGNPFRKKLTPEEAYDVLVKYKGTVFDANLVDVFKLVVLGDDLRAKLMADSRRALIVDPDAEDTTVLELRLVEHGFEVTIARNASDAENELTNDFDVVISEVNLVPVDGFALLQKVRDAGNLTPWVFFSDNAAGQNVQRGFELGADDFITKPASPDVVALKVNRVLDSAGRKTKKSGGVNGSLSEMGLPELVQILYHGRKSGKLSVSSGGKRGEILFSEGQIFDASFGSTQREDGFYEMLRLTDGDFELDPNFVPTEQFIKMNPESMLLEGMRRLDEDSR